MKRIYPECVPFRTESTEWTADKNGLVCVKAGIISAKVDKTKIRLLDDMPNKPALTVKKKGDTKSSGALIKTQNRAEFHPEIDVRGKYADDAWLAVDKYLDDAVLSGLSEVRIIHGKGTGVLRRIIQEYLKSDLRVKSYRNGNFGEGEMGVTVVELK